MIFDMFNLKCISPTQGNTIGFTSLFDILLLKLGRQPRVLLLLRENICNNKLILCFLHEGPSDLFHCFNRRFWSIVTNHPIKGLFETFILFRFFLLTSKFKLRLYKGPLSIFQLDVFPQCFDLIYQFWSLLKSVCIFGRYLVKSLMCFIDIFVHLSDIIIKNTVLGLLFFVCFLLGGNKLSVSGIIARVVNDLLFSLFNIISHRLTDNKISVQLLLHLS